MLALALPPGSTAVAIPASSDSTRQLASPLKPAPPRGESCIYSTLHVFHRFMPSSARLVGSHPQCSSMLLVHTRACLPVLVRAAVRACLVACACLCACAYVGGWSGTSDRRYHRLVQGQSARWPETHPIAGPCNIPKASRHPWWSGVPIRPFSRHKPCSLIATRNPEIQSQALAERAPPLGCACPKQPI